MFSTAIGRWFSRSVIGGSSGRWSVVGYFLSKWSVAGRLSVVLYYTIGNMQIYISKINRQEFLNLQPTCSYSICF